MKSTLCTIALATLVAIASLTQAHAQTNVSKVNVPFAFNLGADNFSAGTYTIAVAGDQLILSNSKQTRLAVIQWRSDSGSPNQPGYVTFREYGNHYFLAEYHPTGGSTVTIGESAKERSLSNEYALSQMDSSLVRLALR